jgi:hypothetical protein
MESAVELKVPLQVKLFTGKCWGSLEPLELAPAPADLLHTLQEDFNKEVETNTKKGLASSLQPVARSIFREPLI